jgi:hypothetical protein
LSSRFQVPHAAIIERPVTAVRAGVLVSRSIAAGCFVTGRAMDQEIRLAAQIPIEPLRKQLNPKLFVWLKS